MCDGTDKFMLSVTQLFSKRREFQVVILCAPRTKASLISVLIFTAQNCCVKY